MIALINKYRPEAWDEVWGHAAAVKALASAVEHKSSQCFLLSGGSGLGKTTMARIAATELGCDAQGLTEIDAATHTGIDDMRGVQELTHFRSLGTGVRAIIIDECHELSRQAWNSLLKATEEPPPQVYWFFCTTRPEKVPKTMVTRSLHLQLREIDKQDLTDLISHVAEQEDIDLPDAVRQLVIAKADGSARQALVNLGACRDIKDRSEAAEVLQSVEEIEEAITLMRLLAKGNTTWTDAMKCVKSLDGINPESIRIQAVNYFAKAAQGARNDRDALFFLSMVEAFSTSYHNSEGNAQLIRSIGRCIFFQEN